MSHDDKGQLTLVPVEPQPTYIENSGRWKWPLPERARFPGCCTDVVTASREWWEYAPSEAKPHPMAEAVQLRDRWYWAVPSATATIPAGWKLVPEEPTQAMMEVARVSRPYCEDDSDPEFLDKNTANTWAAMLDAVPAAPSTGAANTEITSHCIPMCWYRNQGGGPSWTIVRPDPEGGWIPLYAHPAPSWALNAGAAITVPRDLIELAVHGLTHGNDEGLQQRYEWARRDAETGKALQALLSHGGRKT